MSRDAKFRGTFGLSPQPVAGISLFNGAEKKELSIDEMLLELEKSEIRDARKEELLAKLRERIAGTKKEEKPVTPKRYLVDPETGRVDVDEEEGELTYKDALLVSASIKGKSGHYDEAINLINAVKTFTQEGKTMPDEKPKEYYVQPDTGIIVHDPDNGEYTLSEARAISQSLQKVTRPGGELPPGSYIDDEGDVHELKPGQPIVVKKVVREPGKTYLMNPEGELEEHEPGKPIIIKMQPPPGNSNLPSMMPFPVFGADGQPAYDKNGKPIYANLEPMMKWMGFQSDQRRAGERHSALMGMAQTVRENLGDGIAAIKTAAEEAKRGAGAKTSAPAPQPQTFVCGDCQTPFSPPAGWAGQPLKCPGCQKEYSKEDLMA